MTIAYDYDDYTATPPAPTIATRLLSWLSCQALSLSQYRYHFGHQTKKLFHFAMAVASSYDTFLLNFMKELAQSIPDLMTLGRVGAELAQTQSESSIQSELSSLFYHHQSSIIR